MKPLFEEKGDHYQVRGYWGYVALSIRKRPLQFFKSMFFVLPGFLFGSGIGLAASKNITRIQIIANVGLFFAMLIIGTILCLDRALIEWKRLVDTGAAKKSKVKELYPS